MDSSSVRKRSAPTLAHGTPKRHQSVYWKSSLEAGPSGTGNTDTRSRSPERSIFRKHATIPKNMHKLSLDKLPQDDRNCLNELYLDSKSHQVQGVSKEAAMKKLKEQWTQYVEEKYGSREAMGEDGLVDVSLVDDETDDTCPIGVDGDDGEVETEDEGDGLLNIEAWFGGIDPNDSDGALKDVKICKEMNELVIKIQKFAKMFNKKHLGATPTAFLDGLLQKENEQLIRYIGCLAMGGKKGREGWEELVSTPEMREALVVGIMGRALKEHIFSDLYFGASDELKQDLIDLERRMRDEDGESTKAVRRQCIC